MTAKFRACGQPDLVTSFGKCGQTSHATIDVVDNLLFCGGAPRFQSRTRSMDFRAHGAQKMVCLHTGD